MGKKRNVVRWNQDVTNIVSEIDKAKRVDGKGKVVFEAYSHHLNSVLLYDTIDFVKEITEQDKRKIIREAISTSGKKGKITPSNLIYEIGREVNNHFNLPTVEFVLTTSISVASINFYKSIAIKNAKIWLSPKLPDKFKNGAGDLTQKAVNNLAIDPPKDYLAARVLVEAKTISEAANNALDAINLARGIWNLYENRKLHWRMSFGKRDPINKIHLGPFHFLHYKEGDLATESWWCDLGYTQPIKLYDATNNIEKLRRFNKQVRNLLYHHKYREQVEAGILRYSSALDDKNWNNAFLKLWGVLEFLTNSSRLNNERAVKRTLFLFKDKVYNKLLLESIRRYRNHYVHADSENSEIETYLFPLKYFVEVLLEFNLANKYGFNTLEESAELLEQPSQKSSLDRKIKVTQSALDWVGYSKRSNE